MMTTVVNVYFCSAGLTGSYVKTQMFLTTTIVVTMSTVVDRYGIGETEICGTTESGFPTVLRNYLAGKTKSYVQSYRFPMMSVVDVHISSRGN